MEMHSYYEEGTCAWLLVFKCSQCTFNMFFPLVFDSTDVTFKLATCTLYSVLYFVFLQLLGPKSWSGMVIILKENLQYIVIRFLLLSVSLMVGFRALEASNMSYLEPCI